VHKNVLILVISTAVLGVILAEPLVAQANTELSKPDTGVVIGFERVLHSNILEEDRELMIALPDGYGAAGTKSYPLFIVLDARGNFNATASVIRSLARARVVPQMIVVGIKNTNR
jgi:enterochelin esterase-like enzyme